MGKFKEFFEMSEQKVLILMRGTQGSGKFFRAKQLADESQIFSTDEYFERDPRGYRAAWAPDKLKPAHQWNERRVEDAMRKGVNPVVLDNTNMRIKEITPYAKMAYEHGYDLRIEESTSPWWQEIRALLGNKGKNEEKLKEWANKLATGFEHEGQTISNVHGVPEHTIMKKFMQYNPYTVEDIQNYLRTREAR